VQVDFYHLTRLPLDRVLPRIAERVLESGERLLVVAADDALAESLDEALWTIAPESFLAHARTGNDDAIQPILITPDPAAANGARNIALADGQLREEALGFGRAFYFFDEANIATARTAWRALKGREGVEPRYWKQDETGKWRLGP
jgi:DNA polymerase-3 subunit chi